MRVKKVLKSIAGLSREVVVRGYEMVDADRSRLVIQVRVRQRRRGCCGRCGELASFYDQGGGERRWRHVDIGYATCERLGSTARRAGRLLFVCRVRGTIRSSAGRSPTSDPNRSAGAGATYAFR